MIPYQIRIQPELLEEVRASAKANSEGNVNREVRDLIKIGLKNRKSEGNAILISKAPDIIELLIKAKSTLSGIKGSMMAHPDCIEGSEFNDYTSLAEEVEDDIEKLIKEVIEL